MYTDTVLFWGSGIFALFALTSILYLLVSQKRSSIYKVFLQEETEIFNAVTETVRNTQSFETVPVTVTENFDDTETILLDDDTTELLDNSVPAKNLPKFDALKGLYELEAEILGGGMSRIFLARNIKLGNQWIIKFISSDTGELANEKNILKLLNHINLPKIIDIFQDDKGVYLVQSFVEGVSLDKVLESRGRIGQALTLEWAEQLTQVLAYLHNLEPTPIYHLDLKPSNIMVTHDNKLVLIDFGISKQAGDSSGVAAITYNYAAPEQFKHKVQESKQYIITTRFGELPQEILNWELDARTDIYSLGVILFKMATGQLPTVNNMSVLKGLVSQELAEVIGKCLKTDPQHRYQSTQYLLANIHKLKGSRLKMTRMLVMRKVAVAATALSILLSGGSYASGSYLLQQEALSTLAIDPNAVIISYQQSAELIIQKIMPDGTVLTLDNAQIRWSFSADNIARVDGNRIAGLNVGTTELMGIHRKHLVELKIHVVEPMAGMVDISQSFKTGGFVELYAGTTEREQLDGSLAAAEFVSPESISQTADGTVYISDSGKLRKIMNDRVQSIALQPHFLSVKTVRCSSNEVYVLSHEWEDEDGYFYGIFRVTAGGAHRVYSADAVFTAIEDFSVSQDGLLYLVERNAGTGAVYLKTMGLTGDNIRVLCELPQGTSGITLDEKGAVYLANPENGVIWLYHDGVLSCLAGIEGQQAFIDGSLPLFYSPSRIHYFAEALYVWDFNVLRRINLKNHVAVSVETVAGEASPKFDMEISGGTAESVILPYSKLTDFTVTADGILITDPKRGVVWLIKDALPSLPL